MSSMNVKLNFMKPQYSVLMLAIISTQLWLGSRGLSEPDEGRYAEISREMALQSDWLVPHLNGVPHFQKPPLTYWITAISIRLLGSTEYAARLPVSIAAIIVVMASMHIARLVFGDKAGWLAGILLLSALGFFAMAHLITTDMFLALFVTLSICGLVKYSVQDNRYGLLAYYLSMGLAFLTKGPVALLCTIPAGVIWQITMYKTKGRAPRMYWAPGLLIALGLGLSWFIALFYRYPDLVDYFFKYEFVDRIASNVHHRSRPIWYYSVNLILLLFPWSIFFPQVAKYAWHRRMSISRVKIAIFSGWIVVPLIGLHLVTSKIATYLLPLLPGFAVLFAGWASRPRNNAILLRPIRITAGLLAVVFALAPVWIYLVGKYSEGGPRFVTPAFWVMLCMGVGVLTLLVFVRQGELSPHSGVVLMGTGILCLIVALGSNYDDFFITGNSPAKEIAEYIQKESHGEDPIVMACGYRAHGLSFYLQRTIHRSAESSDIVLPLQGEARVNCVTNENAYITQIADSRAYVLIKKDHVDQFPALQNWEVVYTHCNRALLKSPGIINAALSQSP
jgi:4-amino-4-deoxy-L-arabinose transferase-like glycosyltransferase